MKKEPEKMIDTIITEKFQGKKDGYTYKILEVGYINIHSQNKRSTKPKEISKRFSNAVDRAKPFIVTVNSEDINLKFDDINSGLVDFKSIVIQQIQNSPEFIDMVKQYQKKKIKILLSFPKEGIPIFPGKDSEEFINSKKGKRITRRLGKNK